MAHGDLLIEYLKMHLTPTGTLNAVRIGFHNGGLGGSTFYSKDALDAAINEMERRMLSHHIDPITALERLGIELILASAAISDPRARELALESYAKFKVDKNPS